MIGLTGGIASGKSTVSRRLAVLGAAIIDADKLARKVLEPGSKGFSLATAEFPEAVLPDGKLDRKTLGRIIFSDPKRRRALEAIVHPAVIAAIKTQGNKLEKAGRVVVADIPLLYETGSETFLNPVWVVYADEDVQIRRLSQRDGLDEGEARRRIQAQLPLAKKAARADAVIDNNGSLEYTYAQIDELWRDFLETSADRPRQEKS